VPWYLLWPDLHRLVIVNLQDARADIFIGSGKTTLRGLRSRRASYTSALICTDATFGKVSRLFEELGIQRAHVAAGYQGDLHVAEAEPLDRPG